MIVAVGGGPSVIAAKAATATIPIVFTFGADPVFNEPGGNITGVSWFGSNLPAKKLELLLQRSTSSRADAIQLPFGASTCMTYEGPPRHRTFHCFACC